MIFPSQGENRLKELLQKQKVQERKARPHRICERGGYIESILPESILLTVEQFKTFFDMTLLTDFARQTLAGLTGRNNGNGEADRVIVTVGVS